LPIWIMDCYITIVSLNQNENHKQDNQLIDHDQSQFQSIVLDHNSNQ